ncbi:MAG: transposase [Gemmatimonadales bacterium]|nr:transposase [Gemmatimonadales bacterium]
MIYVDGRVFGEHHVLAAEGVDANGEKHVLGIAPGSSENHHVAKDLLQSLIERGLDPERPRLFVIYGSKALRKAILELFGPDKPVQRCRAHKLRNVVERLPKEERDQTKNAMRVAWRLDEKEGKQKLQTLASWLEHQDHPDAAASLREGMDEMFTVNRQGLPSALRRCLATTNIIENPNGGVRRRTGRVSRCRDSSMILRWTAASLLECETGFRKIMGYKDLWLLKAKLDELAQERAAKRSAEKTLAPAGKAA